MGGLSTWFGWNASTQKTELPEIFPFNFKQDEFVRTDVFNIYSKILTDVVERIHGLSEDQTALMWDNCLASESNQGLISQLARAMSDKKELFLVYDKALKLLRIANESEKQKIKIDYEKAGESSIGVFVSFKNYTRSDMVKLYSSLEYCTVAALSKSMNLSKAIQIKINDLRASVALNDSEGPKAQAKEIAEGLANGKDVMLDAKDFIETSKPDLTAVKESIEFLNQKRSFYLGMPESYINGEQTGGIGSSGENDTKAVERGLKNYYFSIMKPVLEAIFKASISYKSQDFRQIDQALNALKTFELVGEDMVSHENKKKIIEKLLDLDEKDNKTKIAAAPKVPELAPAPTKIPQKVEA